MNDLTISAFAGILVSVISILSYKLGRAQEGKKNAEKESNAFEEAKRLRERLENDSGFQKEVQQRFSR